MTWQAFADFSNPAPFTVATLYVLAHASVKTGVLQPAPSSRAATAAVLLPLPFASRPRRPSSRRCELRGTIEMIDGRWGASPWIGPPANTLNPRPSPLLLFDVWNDPLALRRMNDEHPELVRKYTALLQKQ